jgi:hypothetical protein
MTAMKRICTLGLDSRTLSDWRARELPPGDLARIERHVVTCTACQHTLGTYDQIRKAVRSQTIPAAGMPLWRATQQQIHNHPRRTLQMQQKAFILGSLGVLATLVISFAVIFANTTLNHGTSTQPTAITSTDTPTTVPTATPQPLHVTPAQGWVTPAALSFAEYVAFSTSDPLTGYACGTPASAPISTEPPILFSKTHDGGRTWSAPANITPTGQICTLSVNPVNPQDVLVLVGACRNHCDSVLWPWRSLDGGSTWKKLTLPPDSNSSGYVISHFTWSGNTLFVSISIPPNAGGIPSPKHVVAKVIGENQLAGIDTSTIVANNSGIVFNMYPVSGGVAVNFSETNTPDTIFVTTNDGANWQSFIPKGDVPYSIVGQNSDGSLLVGEIDISSTQASLTRSFDGGKTWATLPTGATTINRPTIQITPDKHIFVDPVPQGRSVSALMDLAPGATAWRTVTSVPDAYLFDAVSTLPDGTPNAIWCTTDYYISAGTPIQPGIAYHAP